MTTDKKSFETFTFFGMALDPIHVGTGGTRLGRVDNTIVRDSVTKIPKIPGSSLAGVMRSYTAMAKGKYPNCAGLGQAKHDGAGGHCGLADCPVCTVFGFAKGKDSNGGFAGLAGFSDIHVLLFPVATQLGPQWITCPTALRLCHDNRSQDSFEFPGESALYRKEEGSIKHLNLGWILLPVKSLENWTNWTNNLQKFKIPNYIKNNLGMVSDKLFAHIVNSNLEVRTSVAIDPSTGSAMEGALFTYEALPRGTVLVWEMICRNPRHFKINGDDVTAVESPEEISAVVADAYPYLENLGIGGMGSRGMGRLGVLQKLPNDENDRREALQ